MLAAVRHDLGGTYPSALVDELLRTYLEIRRNFVLGHHEPAELNGGKFCEVLVRILEFEKDRRYTPLTSQIHDVGGTFRRFESVTTIPEALRAHLPDLGRFVYGIRNKRGVGHVGGDVNPNKGDSALLSLSADWVLAELLRLHYQCDLATAQHIVDTLVQRDIPIVYTVGQMKRVLNTDLSFKDQVLLLLSTEFPGGVEDHRLKEWTEYANITDFRRRVLRELHRDRMIEYSATGLCTIMPPGLERVDAIARAWAR